MPLSPGTRLGHYEVVAPLGAGGMGEVYRARDARIERDVAVKVLPAALAQNEDRLRRFAKGSADQVFPCARPLRSPSRSHADSPRRTSRASSTATSSRRTCSW